MGTDRTGPIQSRFTSDLKFYLHPKYMKGQDENGANIYDRDYDIAIIKLNKPIDWDLLGKSKDSDQLLINTICLPKLENFTYDNFGQVYPNPYREAKIYGWGHFQNFRNPDVLQRGDFLIRYDQKNVQTLQTNSSTDREPTMFRFDVDTIKTQICRVRNLLI